MRLTAALWCLALALRARSEPTTSEESLLEIHDLVDEMTDYEKDVRKLEKERGELDGAAHALRAQLANATAAELAAAADASGALARATRDAVGGALRDALLEAPASGAEGDDETPRQAAQRLRLDAAIEHLLGAAASAPSVRAQALEAQLEALTHATALLRARLAAADAKAAAARAGADAAALEASKEIDRLTRDADKARAKADKHDGEMGAKRDEIADLKGNLTEARARAAGGQGGGVCGRRAARSTRALARALSLSLPLDRSRKLSASRARARSPRQARVNATNATLAAGRG